MRDNRLCGSNIILSEEQDLNLRPPAYQAGALTN